MNDATRLRIRRELAELMGYFVEPVAVKMPGFRGSVKMPGFRGYGLRKPGSDLYTYLSFGSETEDEAWQCVPDPFTSHADCAALVEWLAEQEIAVLERFGRELSHALDLEHEIDNSELQHYHLLEFLASPLEARVLAACAALGISTGDE